MQKKTNSFLCFWTWKYKVNLSRKNFWTSPDKALELLSTNIFSFYFLYFYSHLKCILCSTWTSRCFYDELLSHFFTYIELHAIEYQTSFFAILKHVVGGRISRHINYEPCTQVHVNFLPQIWGFQKLLTSLLF